MPTSGGDARRLTVHEAYDTHPIWSPDGSQIAFTSDRYGNNDIFVIQATGSAPTRITYHSTSDNLSSWSGKSLFFETRRTFRQVEWEYEFATVNEKGGTPSRLLDSFGFQPVVSPSGRFIAFVRGSCRLSREAYHGSANRDIWLYDTQSKSYHQLTTFDGQDFNPIWGSEQSLFFISARNGKYNVFKLLIGPNGVLVGDPIQLTSFNDYGVMSMNISGDGHFLVLEQHNSVFLIPAAGGEPHELSINLGTDYRFDPVEHKNINSNATEFKVSPNGKYIVFGVRGEIFITQNNKEKSRSVLLTHHSARDENVDWVNDSTIVFSSDRDHQFDLYLLKSADPNQGDLFKSLKHTTIPLTNTPKDEFNPVVSPDHKKVAFRRGRGMLIVATIGATGKLGKETILSNGWATASDIVWSPDSRWIAYSMDDLDFNEEIYIQAADNSITPINVSMHPRRDTHPFWSKDGSKLGFLSNRNNGDDDVWFAWLKKKDWEKTKQDWSDLEDEDENEGKKKTGSGSTQIDFENIHERLQQVTGLPGNESNLAISNDGEWFYFVTNANGRQTFKAQRDLFKIKWDGTSQSPLSKGGNSPEQVIPGPDDKYLYYLKRGGKLSRVEVKKASVENLPYTGHMDVNHPLEREQIFEEAWRTLRDGFYDPDFHGHDWQELKKEYKSWALSASTETDFHEVFNLMLGQLNASHMGMRGSDRQETQKEKTGLIGVDISPEATGIRINRSIPNSPADRETSRIVSGDLITRVNNQPVDISHNFYAPLVNKADDQVILTVVGPSGKTREVVIRPKSMLSVELYKEWVSERRKLVNEYSGGQLGYLHIRGMNWSSFEEFERELTAQGSGKKGIVIDVRYNGGGWTTDYLMAVLTVRQHAYTVPRGAAQHLNQEQKNFVNHYPFGERLPLASWTKPSIALCNANSYSNAEIFSHAYKTLGIGTLVGTPTFGAVISTGGRRLIDGSLVRLPFRGWYVRATEKSMENIPAVPDIVLKNSPDAKARGKDEQLQRAVEELMKQL